MLDKRLAGRAFLVGDAYTIADMACYPWISPYRTAPIDLEPYPEVRRWQAAIAARLYRHDPATGGFHPASLSAGVTAGAGFA